MSAHLCAPPVGGAAPAAPSATGIALVKRRHVDLMRVCSDGCRRLSA
ncbi:hypothetical protein [Micromonospora halophytica]|uniref:Uncharacterized protein n=1 Tax=Micromonospora halophytica TaxID=47864 RepID=A0A1C5HYI4_9ACTN|nr:hypothetical protein [Micromonospora halophytica]SCG50967.1 hypothetical protein GA0070560_106253 [Micromonospora halophytica]